VKAPAWLVALVLVGGLALAIADTQSVYTTSGADVSGACSAYGAIHVNYLTGARQYCNDSLAWTAISGSGAAWGDITGTLSSQTDLQTALDGKEPAGVAFSDLSGVATGAQLPAPGATTKGGVEAETCSGTDKISAIGTDGVPVCSADETAAGGNPFPVGSVFISVVSTNPATLLGYGTWSAFAAGRVLVGIDAGQTEFDTVEETGGAKTHTLTEAEMPAHVHGEQAPTSASGGALKVTPDTNASGTQAAGYNTASTGGGGAHNNLQPYVTVYMWRRDS
jgi:hypothetical protein